MQAQGSNAGEIMIVQAFRVAGADAAALMNGILEFSKVTEDVASPITIGGKELIVQGHPDTQPQYKSYYYGFGDIVFKLAYNGDNFDEQMAALASQLPWSVSGRSGVAAGLLVDLFEALYQALDAAFFGEDALHGFRSATEDGPQRRGRRRASPGCPARDRAGWPRGTSSPEPVMPYSWISRATYSTGSS